MFIYKLTNSVTGMSYVGATQRSIKDRINGHWKAAKRGETPLIAKAIREFGQDSFVIEELGQADNFEDLMLMEKRAIKEHGTLEPNGYNRASGGKGTPDCRILESAKLKISAMAKARPPFSESHRRNISKGLMGREPWNKGKKLPPSWNLGIPATPETKAKLSLARTGLKNPRATPIEYGGVKYSYIEEAIQATGLSRSQMNYRLKTGVARYCNTPNFGVTKDQT